MQKLPVLSAITAVVIVFSYCTSTKKTPTVVATPPAAVAVSYDAVIKPIMVNNCAPCHTSGGKKEAYDNIANAKKEIDEIIERVELEPGARGFMPKNKPKLSDSDIAMLKKWKETGLAE